MRYTLLAFFMSLSATSFSQTKTDTASYVRMIERFARFYNAANIDSLCTLFRDKEMAAFGKRWNCFIRIMAE